MFAGTLLVGTKTRAGESSPRNLPPLHREVATEATWREPIILSDVLLSSLETKLQNLREQASQEQQFSGYGVDESAAEVASFLSQRIESLERMAKLIEKRRALQNAFASYQQRLNDMDGKISGATRAGWME
jgi:hypothetical protein